MSSAWERDLRRAIEQAAEPAIRDMARDYQRMCDTLTRTHAGQPVAEVKVALRRAWQRIGGDITDPELTQYARQISGGGRIVVTIGQSRR